MIRFNLKCDQNHEFESWFQSSDAFDRLSESRLVSCTACGSTEVTKTLMAPALSKASDAPVPRPLAPAENELSKLREKIETNSDYVGQSFASEARAMHEGTKPERAIYGEAKPDEVRKLIADDVPVLPLPFIPRKQAN